ncbi:MAG: Maf family protein, partial [Schwartzia sp.]|nr:Maf family protein [Schwartzia sp. (in: firmicutes)]
MIYLASGSPRRKELLTQIGCRFEIVKSNAEELKDSTLSPDALVMENACRKAEEAASRLEKDAAVLGADTVVALDGKIFGKPKDEKDAARMLSELSGRS